MTLTYPPIFITLNAYCSPFAVFLKPPLAVSPGARSRSSLLAALIRARAPMWEDLLNLLRLLLGPEHRWCEDPLESALFIIIIIIIIILLRMNRIFEGLKMPKSHETLHTHQTWRKFTSDIGFRNGCGKMAR